MHTECERHAFENLRSGLTRFEYSGQTRSNNRHTLSRDLLNSSTDGAANMCLDRTDSRHAWLGVTYFLLLHVREPKFSQENYSTKFLRGDPPGSLTRLDGECEFSCPSTEDGSFPYCRFFARRLRDGSIPPTDFLECAWHMRCEKTDIGGKDGKKNKTENFRGRNSNNFSFRSGGL